MGDDLTARVAALEDEVRRLRREGAENGLVYIEAFKKFEDGIRGLDHNMRAAFFTTGKQFESVTARIEHLERASGAI